MDTTGQAGAGTTGAGGLASASAAASRGTTAAAGVGTSDTARGSGSTSTRDAIDTQPGPSDATRRQLEADAAKGHGDQLVEGPSKLRERARAEEQRAKLTEARRAQAAKDGERAQNTRPAR